MKQYLGDSVYAEFDGFQIKLTTENGFGPSNTIFMESGVVSSFFEFVERIKHQHTEAETVDDGVR